MLIVKEAEVWGRSYTVTISDDREALQAAYAAGGAVVGLWKEGGDYPGALYLVEDPADADESLLRKAVCRRHGLPLPIAVTERLSIREFSLKDQLPPEEKEFGEPEKLASYICCQYSFYEQGLWALEEKEGGQIVGKAGITDGELGYHIYEAYRGRGFAWEACTAILSLAEEQWELPEIRLRIHRDNLASLRLAGKLGFTEERKESAAAGDFERIFSRYCKKREP